VLAGLAACQYGVVERGQLLAAGLSARTIGHLLARRRLIPLHRSVYAVGHGQLRPEGHRLAAVLACGEGAVLSHRSAAATWGLLVDSRSHHDVIVPAPKATGRTLPGLNVHRVRLADADRAERDAIPVTSVARTLVDLAGSGPRRLVARAVDAALVYELYDQHAVDEVMRRAGRLRGTASLRGVLEQRHPDAHRTRSELEAIALERLGAAGLPSPRVNVWLVKLGVEVDLLWGSERLVVELDGRRYHAHRARRDVERDALLAARGYRVRRFGWGDVTGGAFVPEVAAELAREARVAI